jgi:hypothetical protein
MLHYNPRDVSSSTMLETFLVNDQRNAQILFYVFIYIYNSVHISNTS